VLPFDAVAAEAYGLIIAQCGWVRRRDFDRMVAAHAISTHSTLVTNNAADFRDIPGLQVENWVL
jgi:tRNA(fMet)-specific endonuclease VapC